MWGRGYFAYTAGNVTDDMIKAYILHPHSMPDLTSGTTIQTKSEVCYIATIYRCQDRLVNELMVKIYGGEKCVER